MPAVEMEPLTELAAEFEESAKSFSVAVPAATTPVTTIPTANAKVLETERIFRTPYTAPQTVTHFTDWAEYV
jgi:hypothetical protein